MFELAALAYLIDLRFGEFSTTHPVVLMGRFIEGYERRYYRDDILSGALLVVSLLTISLIIALLIVYACQQLPYWLALPVLAVIASMGLAMRMLHESVTEILTAERPRQALRYLVSRDTETMSDSEVYKAAIETWAENLSDGVIAPLFYLVSFGLPGLAVYKAVNTLDSMIAYKTDRYLHFGRVAAKLDDLANFIPARLTALLIILVSTDKKRAWQCLWRDGNKPESPNAGWPIAAMAGALGVALGGDAMYHGRLKTKPALGDAIVPVTKTTLSKALSMKAPLDFTILGLLAAGIFWS
ncbi:MAG: cobalamin biosynthesis protein CobD [Gammaproteobacteria bacterium HGW-Gammaproteobacteria-10]|nr:MAG: cobalamin biosynthesis protein CobD [Gammaproteobacteria bacterium HGW-Gammaproteobacteria-10]